MTEQSISPEVILIIARSQKVTNSTLRALLHLRKGEADEALAALTEATELSIEAAAALGDLAKRAGLVDQSYDEWIGTDGR